MNVADNHFLATREIDVSLPYRVYLPAEYGRGDRAFPLLMYLHGSGETGTDLDRLERAGLPRLLRDGLELPFVVVCPQCTERWDRDSLLMLLDHLIERYPVDTTRLYLCGVSLGALGVWTFANIAADRFAAIVPICGPAAPIDPERFKSVAIRCIHGAMDSVVPIGESVKMVRALRKAGCSVTFSVPADVDHDVWKYCFDDELWHWLSAHARPPLDSSVEV